MEDQWELCTQDYVGGPMRWGTNENCISRITLGTDEMGDQWELYNQGYIGGPMRWGTNENMVERATQED